MKKRTTFVVIGLLFALFAACKKDKPEIDLSQIARYDLRFIEVTGETLSAHGNHFHGLTNLVALDTVLIQYNPQGIPLNNPHIHLESEAVYQVLVSAHNYHGDILPQRWLIRGSDAKHALFVSGGALRLNGVDGEEEAAILQIDPNLANNEPTHMLSYYFKYGAHQSDESNLEWVLMELNGLLPATKPTGWWYQNQPNVLYPGTELLRLPVEIHVEAHHDDH